MAKDSLTILHYENSSLIINEGQGGEKFLEQPKKNAVNDVFIPGSTIAVPESHSMLTETIPPKT